MVCAGKARKIAFQPTALFHACSLSSAHTQHHACTSATAPMASTDRVITEAELGKHCTAGDAWLAIDGYHFLLSFIL